MSSVVELRCVVVVIESPRLSYEGSCGNDDILTVKQIFDLISFCASFLTR